MLYAKWFANQLTFFCPFGRSAKVQMDQRNKNKSEHLLNFHGLLVSFRDRCNSVVNVLGNCIGVAIVHQVSKGQLGEMEQGPPTPWYKSISSYLLGFGFTFAEKVK